MSAQEKENFDPQDRLLSIEEVGLLISTKVTAAYSFVNSTGVTPIRFSARCTRYRLRDVLAAIDRVEAGELVMPMNEKKEVRHELG